MTFTQAVEQADKLSKQTGEDFQVLCDASGERLPMGMAYYIKGRYEIPPGGFTPDEVVYDTGEAA